MTPFELLLRDREHDVAPRVPTKERHPDAHVRALVDYLLDEAHDELARADGSLGGGGCTDIAADAVLQASEMLRELSGRIRMLGFFSDELRADSAA